MDTIHSYEVLLKWNKEREGTLSSSEITTSLDVATPPPFPKGVSGIWSPEHLFTAAISSCLMTTFLAIAENSKLEFKHFEVSAKGILEQVQGKYLMTRVVLYPILTIANEKDSDRAKRILQKSEAACLISNSVKSVIEMQEKIVIAD